MNDDKARETAPEMAPAMGCPRARSALPLILLSCLMGGAQAAEEPVQVEVFKGAALVRVGKLDYPSEQLRIGNEGWVQLNMMIDPKGKPYEVTVVDSIGSEAFEREALAAARRFRYSPATRGGTAIHSGLTIKVQFHVRGPANGASRNFVRGYEAMVKATEADDRAAADAAYEKLQVMNLYEDAYRNIALYHYHRKWGTELIKLRCDKQYLFFRYQADIQYTVDARNGDCRIELVGDPGTKFDLIQS